MPKTYSSTEVVKVLLRHGFRLVSQRGSHLKLRKDGHPSRVVIVPMGRKDMRRGTLRSILRQADLSGDAFDSDRKDRAA